MAALVFHPVRWASLGQVQAPRVRGLAFGRSRVSGLEGVYS